MLRILAIWIRQRRYWLVSIDSAMLVDEGSRCTDSNIVESSEFDLICEMKSLSNWLTSAKKT